MNKSYIRLTKDIGTYDLFLLELAPTILLAGRILIELGKLSERKLLVTSLDKTNFYSLSPEDIQYITDPEEIEWIETLYFK